MITSLETEQRKLKSYETHSDLVITGGGLSGVCSAITAARKGLKVTLVQDRPVLGGNASSEVRLWILGATSHMGNNNRWAREGGVVDEILIENMYRNPEGNPVIFDTVLLDKVVSEENITLLLNTAVYDVQKTSADTISAVKAFCSQNSTEYVMKAPLFVDASGDGIVGFLSGAAFRMGAESMEEFGEKFAPTEAYGELLGHTIYFYSKDTGKPVTYIPPSYALSDITKIPRYKTFNAKDYGCKLWWIEYGGRLDTIHDTEKIKWELWKVVYGVWNHIKNSGNFPEAENLTLEWVGTIPGKRESRRFEGDYMLRQQDIVELKKQDDAVAFGGWSIDLHPADGVFSEKPGCNQWHSKGIYHIPYRCLYSKNIKNLFLGGRLISASHVAYGSTRVMATAAYASQAVGMAAAFCKSLNLQPAELGAGNHMKSLQQELLKNGHFIPGHTCKLKEDLTNIATISASSELDLTELPEGTQLYNLGTGIAQMVPLQKGKVPAFTFYVQSEVETSLDIELRLSQQNASYTPEVVVEKKTFAVVKGRNCIQLVFDAEIIDASYIYLVFQKNPAVSIYTSDKRITGILSLFNAINKAVSNYGKQTPPGDIGIEEFEFWCPKRRPEGRNIALKIDEGSRVFGVENVRNGIDRPTYAPNAWVANWNDNAPSICLEWDEEKVINNIHLFFDADYDHPMESVLMSHPERVMPFCIQNYVVKDDNDEIIFEKKGNYQTINRIHLEKPSKTSKLTFHFEHPSKETPAALFAVRCYS